MLQLKKNWVDANNIFFNGADEAKADKMVLRQLVQRRLFVNWDFIQNTLK